eukprot:gnl/MRDRNA2_/MRDRNA2_119639_c0_seq1.p1 gnl/MRDRNA2_/MRDRNA2_119639_c0~~gnl/MRDRNA2_/MRDRNA2_119639_c0_seq1.p1  ORF type:complete len:404 (+),score=62.28 gnl/MRDRNA2_/MRDRNA2_119639_c0_seq1:107-1318(+)
MMQVYSLFLWLHSTVRGVLRFPDAGFDLRWPVTLQQCDASFPKLARAQVASGGYRHCLWRLKRHLLDDMNCTAITPNNEMYVESRDLRISYNACANFKDFFKKAYDFSLRPSQMTVSDKSFQRFWQDFVERQLQVLDGGFTQGVPKELLQDPLVFANSTPEIVEYHTEALIKRVSAWYTGPRRLTLLRIAVAASLRLQLLLENLSMSLLVNHLLGNLVRNSLIDGHDYVKQLYGDVRRVFTFRDLGPKRWDVLCYLVDRLSEGGTRQIKMAEIGVDTANVSSRLLARYPQTLQLHVGIDPYGNKGNRTNGDEAYAYTMQRLAEFGQRSLLLRNFSEDAAQLFEEHFFDLVFLDARHDHDSVALDIMAWFPRVRRPGGILAGHDFQWQYPGLPMVPDIRIFDRW